MTVYGYARVSNTDQNLDIQIAALKAAGCEKVSCEKVSGTSTNGRQELEKLLEFVEAGDTIVITRIDRLARSIGDLQDIVRNLKTKGVALKATEQPSLPLVLRPRIYKPGGLLGASTWIPTAHSFPSTTLGRPRPR